MGNSSSCSLPPLKVVDECDIPRFMGPWFVIGVKPTIFETTCSNAVEKYTLTMDKYNDYKKKKGVGHDVQIDFQYNKDTPITSPLKKLPQKAYIQGVDKMKSGNWKVSPMWPIKIPFQVIELADDYSYTVIGYPSRAYVWIMSRKPTMDEETYEMLKQRLIHEHQYKLDNLRKVPQRWTKMEREKRGFTAKEIPDDLLIHE